MFNCRIFDFDPQKTTENKRKPMILRFPSNAFSEKEEVAKNLIKPMENCDSATRIAMERDGRSVTRRERKRATKLKTL